LKEAIDLSRQGNLSDILWYALLKLAEIQVIQESYDEVQNLIHQSEEVATGFHSPIMQSLLSAAQVHLHLYQHQHQLETVTAWVQSHVESGKTEYLRVYEDLILARVWLAKGEPESALLIAEGIAQQAQSDGRIGHLLEAKVLCIETYNLMGKKNDALQVLEQILPIAEPERDIRLFLNGGNPIKYLLTQIEGRNKSIEYAKYLLKEFEKETTTEQVSDILSKRELEVLQLLANGATNQDIMDSLVISKGTVKSHINHIMNKLGARNRTEVVAKARHLGILTD
jgi:LuxR family maltose regulon positive regulatory protein